MDKQRQCTMADLRSNRLFVIDKQKRRKKGIIRIEEKLMDKMDKKPNDIGH